MLKMLSTMIEPASKNPKRTPMIVMVGRAAFLSAWRPMTRGPEMPRARAARYRWPRPRRAGESDPW